MAKSSTDWKRLTTEGFVIVASILLAFSIDAWWEQRRDRIEELEQLRRVHTELRLNSDMLSSKIETLRGAIDASYGLLSWMGAAPQPVETDTFAQQLDTVMGIGTFSPVRRAANDFIADGEASTNSGTELRRELSEWDYYSDRLENQYQILRTEHWTLNHYLDMQPATPSLKFARSNALMRTPLDTNFPFDQSTLLENPVVESLLSTYLLRLEIVLSMALQQEERQSRLLELIDAATGDGVADPNVRATLVNPGRNTPPDAGEQMSDEGTREKTSGMRRFIVDPPTREKAQQTLEEMAEQGLLMHLTEAEIDAHMRSIESGIYIDPATGEQFKLQLSDGFVAIDESDEILPGTHTDRLRPIGEER